MSNCSLEMHTDSASSRDTSANSHPLTSTICWSCGGGEREGERRGEGGEGGGERGRGVRAVKIRGGGEREEEGREGSGSNFGSVCISS